jgi:predicted secreted protein
MEVDRLEDLSVDGRVILRRTDVTVKGREDIAWINQAQDRNKRRAFVNTLYGTAELLSACVEEMFSVE